MQEVTVVGVACLVVRRDDGSGLLADRQDGRRCRLLASSRARADRAFSTPPSLTAFRQSSNESASVQPQRASMSTPPVPIPYTLVDLPTGNTRATYSVPADCTAQLIRHPVLIRGAAFDIHLSDDGKGVYCEFFSPTPTATADAIGIRLASRIEDPSPPEVSAENCILS